MRFVVPKLSSWAEERPASWLDVMPPIWTELMPANSSEETAPRPAVERLPIWAAVKESVALLFVLNNTISASVKPLTDFVAKALI